MAKFLFNSVEFDAPADWHDASILSLVGPDLGGFRPTILVTRDHPADLDLESYARSQSDQLRAATHDYVLHRSEEAIVDARNARMIEHSFKTNEGSDFRQIQVFVAREQSIFTISVTHRSNYFDQVRTIAEGLIRSFRLGEPRSSR
jgi:hypothetical protein